MDLELDILSHLAIKCSNCAIHLILPSNMSAICEWCVCHLCVKTRGPSEH